MPHQHRAGGLRQTNKANKRSNASKRSTGRQGRVAGTKSTIQNMLHLNKADRRNQAKLKRDQKRKQKLLEKRANMPRVIGIVNLGDVPTRMITALCESADAMQQHYKNGVTMRFGSNKLTFLTASSVPEALDMARVCDILVLEVDGNQETTDDIPSGMMVGGGGGDHSTTGTYTKFDSLISETAHHILQALKAQGLPTPLTVLTYEPELEGSLNNDAMTMQSTKSSRRYELHRHQGLRKYINRLSTTEFGDKAKIAEWNPTSEPSVQNLIRTMTTMSCRPASWIADLPRSYILAEEVSHEENTLQISGFVRGGVLDINALFHIPHVGTFAASSAKRGGETIFADPSLRESLDRFATPNALDGEQNLIGFEGEGDGEDEEMKQEIQRPAGWSNYQAAWLDAIDGDENEDEVDYGELADELNTKHSQLTDDEAMLDEDEENLAAAKAAMDQERRKQYKEDAQFPDEMQVPEDTNARDRFQRYRALKNFRKSTWDPKENLPETYANIFHFRNFAQTQKVVMKDLKEVEKAAAEAGNQFFGASNTDEMKDDDEDEDDILEGCIPCGTYVTLCLENFTAEDTKLMPPNASALAAVSLLPHENKVSVLNIGLKHCNPGCEPIKSKDVLTFRCGWRTWEARPVFSQHNLNSDKHKLERFLPDQNAHICASIFGPVTYTPCPVLAFRGSELVAIGSMLGANADRIVVKRILLTGYPVKVRKRTAVVKYMFYNPEDVKWFKPAGLYTKHGLNGHITQSVGEHGTMKCLFNAPIHQHDTVCLPLYKRIFPKYAPAKDGENALEIR